MNINVYLHDSGLEKKVDRLLSMVSALLILEKQVMSDLAPLTASVEKSTTVSESAITLLNGLSSQIAELKNDPAALQALADSLNSESDKLAAAVAANTPAATV